MNFFIKYEGEGIFSYNFKLCHYREHEFNKEGICNHCEKAREQIDGLYRFYYPTFNPEGEKRGEDTEI